jgi:hypothetical protein
VFDPQKRQFFSFCLLASFVDVLSMDCDVYRFRFAAELVARLIRVARLVI